MGSKDPRVDAYIAKSAAFAKPILIYLRELIHETCPTVEETIKWNFPHFTYKGPVDRSPRVLCMMASFKQHCAFGFWYSDNTGPNQQAAPAMGQYGRITSLADLPNEKILVKQIKEAIRIRDAGIKPRMGTRSAPKKELDIPNYLTAALKKNIKARAIFDQFSYTNKKDYVEWLTEAKTDATRSKRLETALEWMSEGKARNWKYMKTKV
jgi:uncharacterized protein YdeI (YjbR/CyaY-like superfamily)